MKKSIILSFVFSVLVIVTALFSVNTASNRARAPVASSNTTHTITETTNSGSITMSIDSTPTDKLTLKDVKSELTTRYGITNFSDCLYLEDLQKKLATVRETQPVTHGLRYGQLLEIGNKKDPSGLVTLSHGLGDSCFGWQDVGEELASRFPHLLFLLPTAPNRAVTINGGYAMPAWYDIRTAISSSLRTGQQDGAGVRQSADYLASLAATTCRRFSIPARRICFCGFSQGAAVSAAAGLLAVAAPPAGVAMMSGYLPATDEVLAQHKELVAKNASFREYFTIPERAMRFAVFHGRQDPVVPIAAAKETKDILEKEVLAAFAGTEAGKVNMFEYSMQHSALPEEINELARFIGSVLPKL